MVMLHEITINFTITFDPRHAWTKTWTCDPSLQMNKLLSVTTRRSQRKYWRSHWNLRTWILYLEKQGVVTGQIFVLSRDRVIFGVRFSSVVQKRFRRRRRWNYVSYFPDAGILFQPNENKPHVELNAYVRTVAPKEVDEKQDTCAVLSNYWWQFFLVARLIKDKATLRTEALRSP